MRKITKMKRLYNIVFKKTYCKLVNINHDMGPKTYNMLNCDPPIKSRM